MKIGLVVRNEGPDCTDTVRDLPPAIEAMGYDALWFTDHVVGVEEYTIYGDEWTEIIVALSYAAATTRTIRLGTSILVVPYRHPVHAAKMLSSIDLLSRGRLNVGVGTGWARKEFDALGAAARFDGRGRWTDDALRLMRRCWEGGQVRWEGASATVEEAAFAPPPAQPAGPPLWVAGNRGTALRRVAALADVWHPFGLQPAQLISVGAEIDELAGRPVARSVRLRAEADESGLQLAQRVQSYESTGCVQVVVDLGGLPLLEYRSRAEDLAGHLGLAR